MLNDADLALAVDIAVRGGFGLTGQACTATSRVIVEEGIADAFAHALAEAARNLKVGNGLESGVQMGPAVSTDQLQTDLSYIEIGKQEGAKLLAGGAPIASPSGFFVQPTVFDEVQPEMRIAQEEIFGPVIGIIRARDGLKVAACSSGACKSHRRGRIARVNYPLGSVGGLLVVSTSLLLRAPLDLA